MSGCGPEEESTQPQSAAQRLGFRIGYAVGHRLRNAWGVKSYPLDPADLKEMARLGRERSPNEACGLLLPTPFKGKRVWEMPNRSKYPGQFEMWPADIEVALSPWFEDPSNHGLGDDIVMWHTHPSGNAGPSDVDLENKVPHLANLIIAVSDEERPIAAFF